MSGRRAALVGVGLFIFVWGLTTHGKYSASGDEPHYLAVTKSLAHDHDLDVSNDYDPAGDPSGSGDGGLRPGPHARPARDGRLMSVHDIGLPVVLVPIYLVAHRLSVAIPSRMLEPVRMTPGLLQYSLISLTLLAVVSASTTLLALGLGRVMPPARALVVAAVVGFSPPVMSHSFLIFPETIAFAVACGVVWWMCHPTPRPWTIWVLLTALGFLPWCHRRYSLFALACAYVLVASRWPYWRGWPRTRWVAAAAVFLIPHAAFHLWTIATWGSIGGPQMLDALPFTLGGAGHGLAGLFMDRQSGLIAYAPIYVAIGACWALTRRRFWPCLVPVASMALPMAAYVTWWAGFAPAARYLVPTIPFLAVALGDSLRFRAMRWLGGILLAAQTAIVVYAWAHPRTLWPRGDGNPLLPHLGPLGRGYDAFLPSIHWGSGGVPWLPLVVLALVNIAVFLSARALESFEVPQKERV